LADGQTAIARQKVERDPHLVVGQLFEVAVVEHLVGGANAIEHRPIVEANQPRLGRVINVLGAVGNDAGF
jgi:hypothetical protein